MLSVVREDRRYHCSLPVRLRSDGWEDFLELRASNLSLGGMFIVSEEVVARVGAEVIVELDDLSLRARVIHHQGEAPGMGLRFVGRDEEAVDALVATAQRTEAASAQPTRARKREREPADPLEQRLLDELAARYELPPHEQLGVSDSASVLEIEAACHRQREKYDPLAFQPCSAEALLLVETLRGFIDSAYAKLAMPPL